MYVAYTIDVIGPEKAEFLIELLNTVGRKDLSAIVREYIDKLDCKYTCVSTVNFCVCSITLCVEYAC